MLPTNTEKKEELRKKFIEAIKAKYPKAQHDFIDDADVDLTVDFFYSEIERMEGLLKAADEVIECVEINTETHFFSINWKIKEALEKYTTLKQQE